jgi:predicted PurR-regulated permease PerM
MIAISKYQEILSELQLTEENMKVDLGDADTVKEAASKAPALLGQFLIFITSLYFFVATRDEFRASVLKLCFSRALRLRMARIFLDIELKVSRYLVQITLINIGLGVATTIAMWLIGVPSPVLWGVLAGLLNYVIYLGPALMAFILFMVGLSTGGTLFQVALPAMVFLGLNLTEAYFVTPQFLGRALTMNPFIVFLALAFWIWIWGPVGGFVAVPSLLITYTILTHVLGQRVRTPKLPA